MDLGLVCQFSARKRIWSVKTFETHSLVRNSHQNNSNIVYFRSYQRISVSIRINAKCKQCTVMRMPAGALFFKPDFNSFFHFALCLFAKMAFCAVQTTKGKPTFRKIENIQLWHFVSSVAQNEIF